ncbi:MAG: M48 family metalloprotease, partial [bacterium]
REMHEEILQQMPIYGDAKVTEYVEAIGQKIIASAGVKKPKFTFTVIDDETINAFALPGGYIYVHRGLITYLNSEAQLAAVIAHEIGHITENHHGRQKRAAVGNVLVAGVLGVLTGSGDVAEASALWGQTLVSGFGRDMELEADQVGAEYLVASGYDPQAMIEVIALLKDQERLERKKARDAGRQARSYHGLFATHPQNDQRLREAVNSAGKLNTRSGDSNVD